MSLVKDDDRATGAGEHKCGAEARRTATDDDDI
jgi:hypothetical protein